LGPNILKEKDHVKRLMDRLRALRTRRDDGASAVEYGLLVALIAVFITGAVVLLGNALDDKLDKACAAVRDGAAAGTCK
jgi:pilus assembly protein Flp/PilA